MEGQKNWRSRPCVCIAALQTPRKSQACVLPWTREAWLQVAAGSQGSAMAGRDAAVRRRASARVCSFGTSAFLWIGYVTALSILIPLPPAGAVLSHDGQILLSFAKQVLSYASYYPNGGFVESLWEGPYTADWNESDSDPCDWRGVLCGSDSAVVRLDFYSWSLSYVNLSTLSSLVSLRELDLSSNPSASVVGLESLTGLTSLYASGTPLTGSRDITSANLHHLHADRCTLGAMPRLRGPSNLRVLSLAGNGLEAFPVQLSEFVNLVSLDLSYNGIHLSGSVPDLEGLKSLTHLILTGNNLIGMMTVPPKLQFLEASENRLTGLTSSLFQTSTLKHVNLSRNRLEGALAPPDITVSVPELVLLDLSWNSLNGTIPGGFTGLKYLDLSNNQLSGAIPGDISENALDPILSRFNTLDLSGNMLGGGIPEGLLRRYHTINLSRNSLDGNIPDDFCIADWQCVGSGSMDLSDNKLEGPLPSSLPKFLLSLGDLWLQNNNLSGDITDLLSQMPSYVNSIRLQGNLFTGDLTPYFTAILYIRELDFSHNRFNMTHTPENPNPLQHRFNSHPYLPLKVLRLAGNNLLGLALPELTYPSYLEVLDLAFCNLSGKIPDSFNSSFPELSMFNVSDNNLTGLISGNLPPSLQVLDISNNNLEMGNMSRDVFQSLPNLLRFYASNNSLQGHITDVSPRTSLLVLNLSHNKLKGRIPNTLFSSLARLEDFDFSDNKLSGPIPPGLNATRFANNPELCGFPLRRCPTPGHRMLVVLCSVLVGVVLLSSTICAVSAYRWRKQHQQDKDLIATLLEKESVILMSLRQLRTATGNFSRSSQIGVGGFGVVYAGQLQDGTAVAIKKSMRMGSPLDKQQFLNEVRILSQVNHRNLVRLLGCCLENKHALLVFEYVPNGNLQERLQGKRGDTRLRLTWRQRLHIALQTAEALDYLHSAAQHPIFHGDVKSANILLDQHLNAKVADFGISKLAPKWATHVSILGIQGTFGYMDPKYCTSGKLTSKSDVYSFGAVLLELISAKSPVNLLSTWEEASLEDLAKSVRDKGDWGHFLDPVLLETLGSRDGRASIEGMACLAVDCLALGSRERPDMKEVRQQLQTLMHMNFDSGFDQLSNCPLQVSNDDDDSPRSPEDCDTGEGVCGGHMSSFCLGTRDDSMKPFAGKFTV